MVPEAQRRRIALLLIIGAGLISTARAMSLSFVAIRLQKSFGFGPELIGPFLGIGPLLGAVAAPFAGSLSDRFGRMPVLIAALMTTALALVALGAAQSLLAFCLSQIACAVALAVYEPMSRALMSDVCPVHLRLRYFSWRYTVSNAGWAVGPLIGIAAGAATTLLFMAAGTVYAIFAVGIFLFCRKVTGIQPDSLAPQHQPTVMQSIVAAARDPRLAFFVGGGTLLIAIYGQWSATLAPYLSGALEGGADIYAYLLSINGVVVLLGNAASRRLIEAIGALSAIVLGCVLFAAGEIGFLVSSSFVGFAFAMVIFTIGETLVVPSEYMLVDGIANDSNRGSYFGAHSFSTIGNFVGPAMGGVMFGAFGASGMFLLFAGFAAASAVLFAIGTRMPPPTPRDRRVPGTLRQTSMVPLNGRAIAR